MRNKYVNRAKISEAKFRELIRFFSLDLTAIQIAELTGLNRNTVNRYLTEIRRKISRYCKITSPITLSDIPETDQDDYHSYSILIRELDSRIYTQIVPSREEIELNMVHERRSGLLSNFDLLIDLNSGNHHILNKNSSDRVRHRAKVNRIESFWGNAKSRLAKFKGMHSSTFRFHLKECEFRFNHNSEDLYLLLLKILRNDPLF